MDDGEQEILTYEQFIRSVQGSELIKHRVRVSFDFDVTCNDGPIRNSRDDEAEKQYDLALLNSFLTADKTKLLHMMVDAIGTEIGLNSTESFMAQFLPEIDTNSHFLFGPAIDALRGDAGKYWRETNEEDVLPWGDVLTLATEKLFECFNADFVNRNYEAIGECEHDN